MGYERLGRKFGENMRNRYKLTVRFDTDSDMTEVMFEQYYKALNNQIDLVSCPNSSHWTLEEVEKIEKGEKK